MSHRPGGRQVRPDQIKAVKGQNGKALVTTGTIKGPLPCPEKGIEKQSIYGVERKNRVKKKRKKDKKENREEKRETYSGHAPVDRFPSLPLQILLSSTRTPFWAITIQVRLPQSY